jgi:hypothetical protein
MYLAVWLAAGVLVVGVAFILVAVRRGRDGDLGSVSGSWIAQHRD